MAPTFQRILHCSLIFLAPLAPAGRASPQNPQVLAGAPLEAPVATVQFRRLEIIQSVQDSKGSVEMVAGRPTMIRAFVDLEGGGAPVTLQARFQIEPPGGGAPIWRLSEPTTLRAGAVAARGELRSSFNYLLPDGWPVGGTARVRVAALVDPTGKLAACNGCDGSTIAVRVHPPVILRLHVFTVRYQVGGKWAEVDPVHVQRLRSWLLSAYPISDVELRTRDLPLRDPYDPRSPYKCSTINTIISRWRGLDVVDQRTRYYAMIPDNANWKMWVQGCTIGNGVVAHPTIVATGPAGSPTTLAHDARYSWDLDSSYADWYGGHEIAHTLGRRHPGACADQSDDDPVLSRTDGRFGEVGDEIYGFDLETLKLLPPSDWFDVMAYCRQVWPSPYTYNAILAQFEEEEERFRSGTLGKLTMDEPAEEDNEELAGPPAAAPPPEAAEAVGLAGPTEHTDQDSTRDPYLHIIIQFTDIAANRAQISSVIESPSARAEAPPLPGEEQVVIRLLNTAGDVISSHPARINENAVEPSPVAPPGAEMGPERTAPRTGVVDVFVPNPEELALIDVFRGPQRAARWRTTRDSVELASRNSSTGAPVAGGNRYFQWTSRDPDGGRRTYFIQISYDRGSTWLTVEETRDQDYVLPDYLIAREASALLRVLAVDGRNRSVIFTSEELVERVAPPAPPKQ